ncbi:LysR family transcriptional regulator [Nitratidesulfovibrio liaohensis]|uniref:LysR family transcriptional regulator n=2 Tax=Nitratidesulfovibrio liaohensis TaxID=2604158 RepID=A0ABY9R4X7_9BACT|nr:LysR family transcriptional regulator [Nitratidesulfovibrio liaohensis]WMW66805.1 LysR family transcriptional regulator [Nitratidesulfovibrio liaohensis]
MDIRHLKTFLAVAAGLSFRKAAEALHYAPSTVTAQIRALEEDLGAPLFERTGRRVLLTDHGRRLLPRARRIAEMADDARRAVTHDADTGELSVRMSQSLGMLCLPEALRRFRARFPSTRVHVATASRHGLAADLRHGEVDLGLLLGRPFAADGVDMETLRREPLVCIAAPGSPLARRGRVMPTDLAGQPLVLTRHVWSLRPAIEQTLAATHVQPGSVLECSSIVIVKRCVAAGQGVAVVPLCAVRDEVDRGELRALDAAALVDAPQTDACQVDMSRADVPGIRTSLSVPVLLALPARRQVPATAAFFAGILRDLFRP